MTGRTLRLALEVDGAGAHPAASGEATEIETFVRHVVAAEAAGIALVTIDDSPLPSPGGRLEAGVRAAYASPRTTRIGLAPTLHATVTEPFHLATQVASLDHASLGRAGWVAGAVNSAAAHAGIGGRPRDEAVLRQELRDVVDVARRLWDSWEDDAVIRDTDTGRFLDPDRVHHVDFTGELFSVVGPLITPRPPQGHPVVLGADTLGVTDLLDVALIAAPDLGDLAGRAWAARDAGAPLVFAEVEVLLGRDRLAALDAIEPWGPSGRLRLIGDATDLRDLLDRLAGVVDGVRLHPAELAVDLPRIAELTAAAAPAGPTLRDALGLPRPANRFATGGVR